MDRYTIDEAMELLGVRSPATLWKWQQRGCPGPSGRLHKPGAPLVYTEKDIRAIKAWREKYLAEIVPNE